MSNSFTFMFANDDMVKWGAFSRWSFNLNFAWGNIETTIMGKTHPTLLLIRLCDID